MSTKPLKGINKATSKVERVGTCVYCKVGIFSDQEHCRASSPMIGKAHTGCESKAETERQRQRLLAEQFPPIAVLERERHTRKAMAS